MRVCCHKWERYHTTWERECRKTQCSQSRATKWCTHLFCDRKTRKQSRIFRLVQRARETEKQTNQIACEKGCQTSRSENKTHSVQFETKGREENRRTRSVGYHWACRRSDFFREPDCCRPETKRWREALRRHATSEWSDTEGTFSHSDRWRNADWNEREQSVFQVRSKHGFSPNWTWRSFSPDHNVHHTCRTVQVQKTDVWSKLPS